MNNDECDCMCHKSSMVVEHIMACCSTCEICGKNIKPMFMKKHLEEHKKEKEKFLCKRK